MTATRRIAAGTDQEPEEELSEEWRRLGREAGEEAGMGSVDRKVAGQYEWLETVGVSVVCEEPHQYLKDRWGGGEYRIKLKEHGGAYIKGGTHHFRVAGPPKRHPDEEDGASSDSAVSDLAARIDAAQGDTNGMMLAMIRESGENARAAQANRTNPMEIVAAITTALTPLLTAFMDRRDPPPQLSMLENMEIMMTMSKQMSGGDDTGFGGLVKTLAEPISKLVEAQVGGAPPAPVGPGNPPAAPAVQRPAWYALFAPTLAPLLNWARGGKDPVLRAEFVIDELNPDQLGPVHTALSADGFRAEFFAHIPPAAEHRDWFCLFFDAMLAGITFEPDEAAALPAAAPAADAPEPIADAETHKQEEQNDEDGTGAP